MKKIQFLFVMILSFAFVGCFDIIETFTFNENGSGVYEQQLDMSRFMSAMNEMGGESRKKKKAPEKRDSIIYYKDMVDTASNLNQKEKDALRNSYATIHLDEEKGEIQLHAYYPFKTADDFAIIQNVLSRSSEQNSLIDKIGNSLFKGKQNETVTEEGEGSKGDDIFPSYSYFLTATNFSRKLVEQKTTIEKKEDSKIDDLPEEMKAMMKINLKTIIHLPRASKNVVGENAEISADKKTIQFNKQIDFNEKNSKLKFAFSIDY